MCLSLTVVIHIMCLSYWDMCLSLTVVIHIMCLSYWDTCLSLTVVIHIMCLSYWDTCLSLTVVIHIMCLLTQVNYLVTYPGSNRGHISLFASVKGQTSCIRGRGQGREVGVSMQRLHSWNTLLTHKHRTHLSQNNLMCISVHNVLVQNKYHQGTFSYARFFPMVCNLTKKFWRSRVTIML